MGVEVVAASDVAAQVPVEAVNEVDKSILHEKENGKMDNELGPKEAIKFGSHEREVEKKGVGTDVADANARMNADGEWKEKVYYFYIPKMHSIIDPKYKPQLEELDRQVTKLNEALNRVYDRLRAKKDVRQELNGEVRELREQLRDFNEIMDDKRKEMHPLQEALGKLRNNNNGAGRGGICSSEEELNRRIRELEYRIQHESIPLSEEKQILREIKQLELSRPEVIAKALVIAKIQEKMGQKDAIQDQVKHMNVEYDGVKKEQAAILEKFKTLKGQVDALDNEIKVIEGERNAVKEKRDELLGHLREVRAQSEEVNASFYAYRGILNQAKTLAVNKDVQGIEQLVKAETEKFMLQWRDKAFRDDYKKRLAESRSLDRRSFTLDGRTRLADEKPIAVVTSSPPPSQVEPLVKPLKKPEETKPAAKKESLPAKSVQKKTEQIEEDEEEVAGLKAQEKTPPPQVDAAKLKEMKREEEIAKAKLAMERKKKLAEKAAAKAAKRAEKEAEKKLKDREKKLKKKAGGSGPTNEEEKVGEESVEGSEPEETKVGAAPAPVKEQVKRENPVRYRNRARGPESLPRALLKKKKSTNYWLWAAPAAVVAVLLVFLAYYYLL